MTVYRLVYLVLSVTHALEKNVGLINDIYILLLLLNMYI